MNTTSHFSTAFKEGKNVFRPAAEAEHAAALDPLGEIGREGKAQIAARETHLLDAMPGKHRLEAAHNGFDFREFRHGALLDQFVGKDKNYP